MICFLCAHKSDSYQKLYEMIKEILDEEEEEKNPFFL